MPTCEVSLIESLRVSKFSYFHSYWPRLLIDYYCSVAMARNSEYSKSLDSEVSMSETDDFEKDLRGL